MQYLIIDIIFKEEFERIIGIKSIEDLTNGKTDVEAYINNNAIIYYHKRDYYDDDCLCIRRRIRGYLELYVVIGIIIQKKLKRLKS